MTGIVEGLRFALRMLAKSPGFTAVAVLTLALGLGSTTAIFSVIYGVLLRPLAVPQARQVVQVVLTKHGELSEDAFTYAQFRYLQDHAEWFTAIAAFTHVGFNLNVGQETGRVSALHVTSDYFRVLDANPILGRAFTAEEDKDPAARVAILSLSLWNQQFAGDPAILDRTIYLNGSPYRVVGVMPAAPSQVQLDLVAPAFGDLQHIDLWTTLSPVAQSIGSGENLEIVSRVKPDRTIAQASAQLDTLTESFRRDQLLGEARQQSLALSSVQKVLAAEVSSYLWILLAAVGFVLLIACANISNLLLARGATRKKEVAVRAALGASRLALIRQFLLESLVLSATGGLLGFLLAEFITASLLRFVPLQLPRSSEIRVDTGALLFALAITVLAGISAGLVPALRAASINVNAALKENAAQSSAGVRSRFRSALVVSEVALSLLLLIGASLLAETFLNLLRIDPGFQTEGLLSAEVWLTGSRLRSSAELSTFYDNLTARLKQLPGVEDAAVVSAGQPLERGGNEVATINGTPLGSMDFRVVTPPYFRTLKVNILSGRDFDSSDSEQAEPVAIVNEAFVQHTLKTRDPFTSTVCLGDDDLPRRIVGVAANIKSFVGFPSDPTIFIPASQAKLGLILAFDVWFPTHVLVRTSSDPRRFTHSLQAAIRETDASIPVGHVLTMDQIFARSLATQRFMMLVVTVFAALAMALAAIGIYGVIAFSVSQRTHELGIRRALGADRTNVLALVLREGAHLALSGAVIGLVGTLALHKALNSVLFGVRPGDWRTMAAATFCLLCVAFLACYIPARRATKVDPNVALRCE